MLITFKLSHVNENKQNAWNAQKELFEGATIALPLHLLPIYLCALADSCERYAFGGSIKINLWRFVTKINSSRLWMPLLGGFSLLSVYFDFISGAPHLISFDGVIRPFKLDFFCGRICRQQWRRARFIEGQQSINQFSASRFTNNTIESTQLRGSIEGNFR